MPDAAWAVNGYPPGSSQGRDAALVPTSSHCVSTRQRQRTLVHRSSSRPAPDAIEPRLFPRRSAQRSSANAPVGGLKPPPVGRLQRARQPLSLLQHRIQRDHHLPIRPASCVRVHNFSRTAPLYGVLPTSTSSNVRDTRFSATTGRSASERRVGTQCLRFLPRHAPSRDLWGLRPRWPYRRSPSHVPCKSRRPGSRRLHAGHHLASSRVSARLVLEDTPGPPILMPSERVSTLQQRTPVQVSPGRALLERLPGPHLTRSSRAVSPDAHHDSLQLTQLGVV